MRASKEGDVKGRRPAACNRIFQARFPAGEIANSHQHDDMYEVFYVEQGRGLIRVDNQEIVLEQGVCVSVEPGETHEIENTGKEELVVNYFGVIR